MLNQHPKKHRHAGTPNVVRDPLVDPGNPSHRYQARSTAHLDRPRSRMVALAASPPGPRSPRSPQAENATVMLVPMVGMQNSNALNMARSLPTAQRREARPHRGLGALDRRG